MNPQYECWINAGSVQIRMPNTTPVEAGNLHRYGPNFSYEFITKQPVLKNVEKAA